MTTSHEGSNRTLPPSARGGSGALALGASPTDAGTALSRCGRPRARRAAVRLFDAAGEPTRTEPLTAQGGGIFECLLPDVRPGTHYTFVLDDRELTDPYARFLPFGVHGPARVEPRPPVPRPFTAPAFERWIIYELHVGTFTAEGTWAAARDRLDSLVDLGVNAIEVMPIAAFAGLRHGVALALSPLR